ncbi:MAG: FtsX-like permease family protein [Planctomycetes bacterium]|nr:FtsX-like permease family protein [Planctomycetota bacterium]
MPRFPHVPALVLRAFVIRPVLRRPWRFIITVIGVAVGVASILATWLSSRAAVASMREGAVEIAGRARVEVTQPGGLLESELYRFRPLADRALIAPVIEEFALAPKLKDTIRVLGVDVLLDRKIRELDVIFNPLYAAGNLERALAGAGALVPEPLARELNLEAGGILTIHARSKPVEIPILALLRPRSVASAWNRTIVIDIAYAQEIFGRIGRIDRLELLPRIDNLSIEDAGLEITNLESRAREAAPPGARVGRPNERAEQADRMVQALQFNLTALSGISLIVGSMLVATTLATSVVQRRSIIALLRSLGASNLQIATAVFFEASAIGLLGGALGVVAGVAGARASLAGARTTVASMVPGVPATELYIPWWAAACGVALGLFNSSVAAILPLREAMRTPPLQGLRRERPAFLSKKAWLLASASLVSLCIASYLLALAPALGGLPYAALASSFALLVAVVVVASPALDAAARLGVSRRFITFPMIARAGLAALSAGRSRAAWAAGAVGMAVALAISITTMVGSFRETVFDFVNQTIRSDVWIRPRTASTGVHVGRLDPEIVNIALREFGGDVVDPFHETTAFVRGEPISLCAGEYRVVQRAAGLPFVDGRDPKRVFADAIVNNSIMINEPLSNRFGIRAGDTIEIAVPSGILRKRVEGVFYDYSRSQGMAVLDRAEFLQLYPDDGPREVAFFLNNAVEAPAVRSKLIELLGGKFEVDILLNRELRGQAMEAFDRSFEITKALEIVSRIVAIVAVLTVLFALVDERRHDFALVRALGGSKLQVIGMVFTEGICLGIISVIGGFVFGLLVGVVLVKVINLQSFGWTMRLLPPWTNILSIACSVTFVCGAAALPPAWFAARRAPRELLQDDV